MEAAILTPSGRISLGATTLRIGSDASNKLSLTDPQAAPFHAQIALVEGSYQLTDLGSVQGTLVNGQAIAPNTPVTLQHGDTISIGATSLTFEMSASAEEESTAFSPAVDEIPTERIPSVNLQQSIAEAETLAVNEEAPTELIASDISEAVTAITPTPVEAPATSALTQAETPTPVEAPAQPVPPTEPAPLYTVLHLPLDVNGQLIPQAIPLQTFPPVPAGYPAQPVGAISGPLPQPGYPAQPGYTPLPGQFQTAPTTAPAAKKRGRVLLWVALIVVMLLLLAGSNTATYALSHAQTAKPAVPTLPSPKGTLQTYCQGILTSNSEEIYDLLSAQAKTHTSLDDIQKAFNAIGNLNASSSSLNIKYTNCTFGDIRVSDTLAVATVSLTMTMSMQYPSSSGPTSNTLTETLPSLTSMVWENHQWKIDFSQMSQPQPTVNFSTSGVTPTTTP